MADSEDRGFTVHDRRFSSPTEAEPETPRPDAGPEAAPDSPQEPSGEAASKTREDIPLPEITFVSFLMSISSTAFMHLGDIADPASGEINKDLPLAQQTIDLLGLLRQKTQNNLSPDEEQLFDSLLYELRMRYVKEAAASKAQ